MTAELLPVGATPLVSMVFGSHVYGTDVATSDRDIKGVFLPPGKAILMQKVRDTICHGTKADKSIANAPDDVDTELFSLQRYLNLLLEGQTNAIDMLFTPESFYIGKPHSAWDEICRHKKRFLHSGVTAFARYCRQQASKYGIKGSRVAALRSAIEFLAPLNGNKKLSDFRDQLSAFVAAAAAAHGAAAARHIKFLELDESQRKNPGRYLEVAGRKVPIGSTVKLARQTFQRVFDEFGQRALLAEKNEGIDWKALMHAVRVASEAKELLLSGVVTFPRPERALLLRIRKGELPYEEVASLIEGGVDELEQAKVKSALPAVPDRGFAEDLICRHYSFQTASLQQHRG